MPSKTSPTSPSNAGSGLEGKDQRNKGSSPSEEEAKLHSVTYDPPPASWFFGRGGKNDTNEPNQKTNSEANSPQDAASNKLKASTYSTETQDHSNSSKAAVHFPSNVDPGMVSDNDEEDEHEGFNFIAISNSLLMAGRSFEHVPDSSNEDADAHSRTNSDKHQGVLIVDGVASDSSDISAPMGANINHNADASVLTIPGSDSLPSDIGTICHHEEDDEDAEDRSDPLFGHPSGDGVSEQGHQDQRDALEDPDSDNHQPLVHRFLKNLKKTRRLRKVSDASDVDAGFLGSDVSVVRNDDDMSHMTHLAGWDLLKFFFARRTGPIVLLVFTMVTGFACNSFLASQRNQREAWELSLQREREAMTRILAEKESLRQEIEILMEEAAVASARAESLAKEQERLLFEREEAEKAEKERIRLLQEQEQRKQKERQNQKRRRQQPWRSDVDDGEDFGWFFDDSNEECNSHNEDGSSTYTIADNCWIKAKADINLGNCGGETKDYLKDFWNGLWEDWDYYFDEPTRSDAVESFPKEENDPSRNPSKKIDGGYFQIGSGDDHQGHEDDYQYQDDTYYPPQDPLQDLFSVIHSAGQSFVSKLSSLMSEEVESTQKAAREMEETAKRKYEEASETMVGAIEIAKEDVREMSKEALTALRTAILKSNSAKNFRTESEPNTHQSSHSAPDANEGASPPTEAQQITRKGLYDAASAVSSLSKSWQEYAKSLSVVGEKGEQ